MRPPREGFIADITFPAVALYSFDGEKFLGIFSVEPLDMLHKRLPTGMELATEWTLVVLPGQLGLAAVPLPMYGQVGFRRVSHVANITLKRLFSRVDTCVTFIFTYSIKDFFTLRAL